jgi:hypothetical protein
MLFEELLLTVYQGNHFQTQITMIHFFDLIFERIKISEINL